MVLKAEMQSQETEPSNFYSSPLIKAEEDIQSGKFEASLGLRVPRLLLHHCSRLVGGGDHVRKRFFMDWKNKHSSTRNMSGHHLNRLDSTSISAPLYKTPSGESSRKA